MSIYCEPIIKVVNSVNCALACDEWKKNAQIDYNIVGNNKLEINAIYHNVNILLFSWGIDVGGEIIYKSEYKEIGMGVEFLDNNSTINSIQIDNSLVEYLKQNVPIFYNGENINFILYSIDEYGRENKTKIKYTISL